MNDEARFVAPSLVSLMHMMVMALFWGLVRFQQHLDDQQAIFGS